MEDLELVQQELERLRELNRGLEAAMGVASASSDEASAVKAEDETSAVKAEDEASAVKAEDEASAVKAEDEASAVKAEEEPSAVKAEEEPSAVKAEEEPSAVKAEEEPSAVKTEEEPSAVKTEEGASLVKAEDEAPAARGEDGESRLLRQKSEEELLGTGAGKRHGRRIPGWVVFFLVLAVIAAGAFSGLALLRWQGQRRINTAEFADGVEITAPEGAEISSEGRISYNGRYYIRNENIISILGMGIDQDDDAETRQEAGELLPGEQGQADTIIVAALDQETGKLDLINISRDSMADVDVYNVYDEYVGTEKLQICLAYAYGGNEAESCANMLRSVSRLMYGIPINAYAAIDIPAIAVLNDAIGGVEVTVLEDLSARDPELTEGAVVTLDGSQARTYVRVRDHVSVDANNARMQRQRQYATAFLYKLFSEAKENISIVLTLYQAVRDYMTTDLDLSQMLYLANIALRGNYSEMTITTVPGEVTMGEKYAEYHVDDEALYKILLDVFYTEVTEDGTVVESAPGTETALTPAEEETPPTEEETKIVTVDREILR